MGTHELHFSEWLRQEEGVLDYLKAGANKVIGAVDTASTWINDVAARVPQLAREILAAYRDMVNNPQEFEKIGAAKGGLLQVIQQLNQLGTPQSFEQEATEIMSIKDAGQIIAFWQASKIRQVIDLIVKIGSFLHFNQIIMAIPQNIMIIADKAKAVIKAENGIKKAAAIVSLTGAFLSFLHVLLTSAFISGIMAKIALMCGQFGLAGILGVGCYVAWGVIILLAATGRASKSKVLKWMISFVLAIIHPAHHDDKHPETPESPPAPESIQATPPVDSTAHVTSSRPLPRKAVAPSPTEPLQARLAKTAQKMGIDFPDH